MAKKGCMICGKEKSGLDIQEDYVLHAMRWFKRNVTKNAKNYKIVVCKECLPQYKKLRAKFTRRRAIYTGLGIVFTATLFLVSDGKSLGIVIYGLAMTVFLYILSLAYYLPALKDPSKLTEITSAKPANKKD